LVFAQLLSEDSKFWTANGQPTFGQGYAKGCGILASLGSFPFGFFLFRLLKKFRKRGTVAYRCNHRSPQLWI
jgi:hypothetical protein